MTEATKLEALEVARERADKAVRDNADKLGKPGWVARASEGKVEVIPWYESVRADAGPVSKYGIGEGFPVRKQYGPVPIPQEAIRQAKESLPPRKRRTGAKRLEGMTKMLIEDAIHAYETFGKPVVARSIADEICRVAALAGVGFMTPEKVERMTLEEIRPHLEALAKRQFIEAGHKQVESDRKKVIHDWSRSGNHQVSAPSLNREVALAQ